MNALKRVRLALNRNRAPAMVIKQALAIARTVGAKAHLISARDDAVADIADRHGTEYCEDPDRTSRLVRVPAGGDHLAHSRPRTVDALLDQLANSDGIDLLDLEPMTTLVVRTTNSVYRIVVLQHTTVLLQGGSCIPEVTVGHLAGSGLGGRLLKLAWIGVGLRMDISIGPTRIVTSPVSEITIESRRWQSADPDGSSCRTPAATVPR